MLPSCARTTVGLAAFWPEGGMQYRVQTRRSFQDVVKDTATQRHTQASKIQQLQWQLPQRHGLLCDPALLSCHSEAASSPKGKSLARSGRGPRKVPEAELDQRARIEAPSGRARRSGLPRTGRHLGPPQGASFSGREPGLAWASNWLVC